MRSGSAFSNGQLHDISGESNTLPIANIFIGTASCQGFWMELPDKQEVRQELLQGCRGPRALHVSG